MSETEANAPDSVSDNKSAYTNRIAVLRKIERFSGFAIRRTEGIEKNEKNKSQVQNKIQDNYSKRCKGKVQECWSLVKNKEAGGTVQLVGNFSIGCSVIDH